MEYAIENEYLIVTVTTWGAQVKSVVRKFDDVEHMWQADKSVWGYHAPILFPHTGKVVDDLIEIKGEVYQAKQHGFARLMEHTLVLQTEGTHLLLDAGISDIWAKSVSKEHARILQRIGARHIINAETDAGKRVGHLVSGNYLDYIELEGAYSVVKIHTPPHVVGYSIEDARVHERFGITVVGVKSPGKEFEYGSKELIMHRNDELIIMGKQDQIDKFLRG